MPQLLTLYKERLKLCQIDQRCKKVMQLAAIVFMMLILDHIPTVDAEVTFLLKNDHQSPFHKYLRISEEDDEPSRRFLSRSQSLGSDSDDGLMTLDDAYSNYPRKIRHNHHLERVERNTRNLHEPVFDHSSYSLSIDEDIPIGSTILTVRATDEDLDANGIIIYSLRDTNDFRIDVGGVIYSTNHLDYESTGGTYRFSVVARNPHSTSQGTRVPITIRIRDKPDAPIFDSTIYYFNISEFAANGDYVGTVVARDGDNDLDSYSLKDVNPRGLFAVDSQNGIITVADRSSAFETKFSYEFYAVANDSGGAKTVVPVHVNVIARLIYKSTDENTNKPIFENCSGYNNLHVLENQTVPENILMVEATDADHGQNGMIVYSLLTNDPQFTIDPNSGQISIIEALDRDRGEKEHFLTVIAKDMAEDPLQSSCSFTVIVDDINDNPPIFDHAAYAKTVPSDTQINAPILRMTASDVDAGRNAEVLYTLRGATEDLEYFSIDQNSGFISLKKALDRSMANSRIFSFMATASDVGEVGQTSLRTSIDVVLEIVSPGAMAPSVEKQFPSDTVIVNEDATKDTNIVSICARPNSARNEVFMDIINGNVPETNSEGTFDIRTASTSETGCPPGTKGGNIFLATSNLDYEEIQAYTLIVQLANENGISEHSLFVQVVDVNDNPPVLQQPYSGSISENVPATMVMVAQAVDKDVSQEFRQLTYSFKNPPLDVKSNFRINPITGEIWTLNQLDREKTKQFRIPVQVSDGENVRDRQYWIVVNDQNDCPPHFNMEKGVYETEVDEDLTLGKDTGIVLVVEDEDILNEFSYQIISGNEKSKFKINQETGVISVHQPLDYDSPTNDRNFTMEVRVSDGKSYNDTVVHIMVRNKNDQAPIFNPAEYFATVTENTDCNINVTRVSAYDPDYPENGDIIYVLTVDEQRNFTIDKTSGTVSVKNCLDREAVPLGTLTIYPIAYDEGGVGINSEPAPVKITIKDVNDNYPFIQSPPNSYTQFMENVAPEDMKTVVIIQLSDADDASEGNGCPCAIAFDESTPPNIVDSFAVKKKAENQYQLVTRRMLDREAQKFYVIPFKTTDNKGMSGIRKLTVEVGDENDSPMSDGESKIYVYNYRSSFPDIIIGSVYVTDADDYDVEDKTFELDPGTPSQDQQYFSVNYNAGNITMLRGTPQGQYLLIVKVHDHKRNEEAQGKVHIIVTDLPREAVMESGSFIISDLNQQQVVAQQRANFFEGSSLYDRLRVELGNIFYADPKNVDIFNIRNVDKRGYNGVEIRFNVHGSPYLTSSHLNGLLSQNKKMVEDTLGIKIPIVNYNPCLMENFRTCNGTSCQQELRADNNNPLIIESGTSTLVGVQVTEKYTCSCGDLDPTPAACPVGVENYCYNGGECRYSAPEGLHCTCPDEDNYGPRCELLNARLKNGFAWFDPLGTCEKPTFRLTFQSDEPSAVLLYNGPIVAQYSQFRDFSPRDFLYLVLNNWNLEAYLDLGSGTYMLSLELDARPYEAFDVFLSWTKDSINLTVPNCGRNTTDDRNACRKTTRIEANKKSILNVGGPLQLGGLAPMASFNELRGHYGWDISLPSIPPLSGCISYLNFNGEIYDMNRTSFNKYFYRTCAAIVLPSRMKMSSESVFIIVGSLLVLLVLVLIVLLLLRRRRKPHSYQDHSNEIVKETIGITNIEGYEEKDMDQYDLKLLRVTPDGVLLNGYGTHGNLPDVAREHLPKQAPIARLSEGFNIEDFIGDNTKKVDKEHPEWDDVRHYCYEGDAMSIASLSSLGSGTSSEDRDYNYQEDWGPRFKTLADIYKPAPDEEDDSDYEFPIQPTKTSPSKKYPYPKSAGTPTSSGSPGDNQNPFHRGENAEDTSSVPYVRLGHQASTEEGGAGGALHSLSGKYHEEVNPLNTYAEAGVNKESWC